MQVIGKDMTSRLDTQPQECTPAIRKDLKQAQRHLQVAFRQLAPSERIPAPHFR